MLLIDPLAVGRKVTIWPFQSDWTLPENGLAIIEEFPPDKSWLRLAQPFPPLPLKEGESVRIQSTTKEALHLWDGEIFEVCDSARQRVVVSIPDYRVVVSIPDDGVIIQRKERLDRYIPHSLRRPLNDFEDKVPPDTICFLPD
jgi:hypothetical protein